MLKKSGGLLGVLALLLAGAGWAEGTQSAASAGNTCTDEAAIEAFLRKEHPGYTGYVLSFNHKNPDPQSRWKGWRSAAGNASQVNEADGFEVDFTGKPKWELDSGKKFLVLVTDTNPLVFGTEFTGADEAAIEGLAEIQKLAGLVGGFTQGLVAASGAPNVVKRNIPGVSADKVFPVSPDDVPEFDGILIQQQTDMDLRIQKADKTARTKLRIDLAKLLGEARTKSHDLDAEARSALRDLREELRTAATSPTQVKKDAAAAAKKLGESVATLEHASAQALVAVQKIERGTPPTTPFPLDDWSTVGSAADDAAADFSDAAGALGSEPYPCVPQLASFQSALSDLLKPKNDDLPNPETSLAILRKFHVAESQDGAVCTISKLATASVALRNALADRLAAISIRSALPPFLPILDSYLAAATERDDLLKKAPEILAKRKTITLEGARLAALHYRAKKAYLGACGFTSGVIAVHRGEGNSLDLDWSQTRTEKFKIAADPAFQGKLELAHFAPAEISYSLENQRFFDLGIGAGLVYTELEQPKWTAVEVPDPADANKKIMVIAANGSESRAGEVALFLDLEPRPWQRHDSSWRWGFQIGAGVDTDHPALFAGVKVQWKFLRLGLGTTFQEIQELDGKKIGDTVASKDAIPLRDDYGKSKTYLSLTIAIDDLPFWSADGGE